MKLCGVWTLCTLLPLAYAGIFDKLSKCNNVTSAEFDASYKNASLVCSKDLGTTSIYASPSAFCNNPNCLKLQELTGNITANCKPNASAYTPAFYCSNDCQKIITEMQTYVSGCKKVSSESNINFCTVCTKYQQAVNTFIDKCGLLDSTTALWAYEDLAQSIQKCSSSTAPPVLESNSSSTTYIIVGIIGGVIVLGAAAYCMLKKKSDKNYDEYRSMNGNTGGSRGSSGMDSNGQSRQNQLVQVKLQNDIRFDAELSQFRIPQQEIQNISLLVKGGYGVVFHATFGKMDVAMKQLLPSKAKDPNAIQDFMNEIRLCARLEHPKIVKFVGISWSTLQDLAVLSEFMSNGDVTGLIRKERKKPENQRLLQWIPTPNFQTSKTAIAADVVDALVYLHSFQPTVIHRDLKSKNVLLSETWEAKLSDFGISRVTSLEETMTSNIGTVAWIAPEVLTGGRYTEKADIYSFGVLLSELDTLQVPYAEMIGKSKENGFSNARLAMMVSEGNLQPSFTEDIPIQLLDLARDCLSFSDNDRPSAMKLSYQLHSILKEFEKNMHYA